MNPAILVLLWIRLSVTFGYPAAHTGLLPRIRTHERISPYQIDQDKSYAMAPAHDGEDNGTASTISESLTQAFLSPSISYKTSPYSINDYSSLDGKSAVQSNDTTRIISIVRVSASTSVVKPKRLERVTKSVNESRNYYNAVIASNDVSKKSGSSINETNLETMVTPFISLLRKNRFDVYENDGPETLDVQQFSLSASSTSASSDHTDSSSADAIEESSSRYRDEKSPALAAVAATEFHRQSKSINDTNDTTEMITEQYTFITETDRTQRRKEKSSSRTFFQLYDEHDYADQRAEENERNYEQPEEVYGEPEKVYGESEKVYGEPEKMYEQPEQERTYEEEEKYKSETMHDEPETEEEFVKQDHHFGLGLPGSAAVAAENSNSYSLFTTRVNDKKSSFIIDNGTHRKYRVEEKTPDGFIVGEYGMVSHRDGSLRGVRYTADSNINPSLIYQTLVKFLSLK